MRKSTVVYRGIRIENFIFIGYIYCIVEMKSEDTIYHYIGMTTKLTDDRIDEHIEQLENNIHCNKNLQKLFDNRRKELGVIVIESVIASSYRDLIILLRYKEKQFIKLYNPTCNIIHNKANVDHGLLKMKIKSKDKTIPGIVVLNKAKDI